MNKITFHKNLNKFEFQRKLKNKILRGGFLNGI